LAVVAIALRRWHPSFGEFGLPELLRVWRTIVKMLLNDVWAHISYEDDGHLVRTDKRTGKQKISFRMWPDITSANRALTAEQINRIAAGGRGGHY
jgi:hypothetical protein